MLNKIRIITKNKSYTLLNIILIILVLLLPVTITEGDPSKPIEIYRDILKDRLEVGEHTFIKITITNNLNETIWVNYVEDPSELSIPNVVGFTGFTNTLRWSGKLNPYQSFYGEYKVIPVSKGKFNLSSNLTFCRIEKNSCENIIDHKEIYVIKSPIIGNIKKNTNLIKELTNSNYLLYLTALFTLIILKSIYIHKKRIGVETSDFKTTTIIMFTIGIILILLTDPLFIPVYILLFFTVYSMIYIFS